LPGEALGVIVIGQIDDDHLRFLREQPERTGRLDLLFAHRHVAQRLAGFKGGQQRLEVHKLGLVLLALAAGLRFLEALLQSLDAARHDL
jgi:hypothetical protein